MPSMLSPDDERHLRRAIALSEESKQRGKHPFASFVLDADGNVLAQTFNDSLPPHGDPTRHAELLAAAAAAHAASPEVLAKATLYTSAEPCAMCSGAIYWVGIGRVVYGLSEAHLLEITGSHPENPTLSLPCREVFARGQREIEVVGPELEEEAAKPHLGFWA